MCNARLSLLGVMIQDSVLLAPEQGKSQTSQINYSEVPKPKKFGIYSILMHRIVPGLDLLHQTSQSLLVGTIHNIPVKVTSV